MTRKAGLWLAATVAVAIIVACSSDTPTRVEPEAPAGLRVASFDFAESILLAEVYSQVIESAGVPVVRLGPVGPREIIAPSLELGRIDLIPEYLGTALQYHGAGTPDPETKSARRDLNRRLEAAGLVALEASPAEDKNVFVVTAESAEVEQLQSISDLSGLTAGMRFGGPPECQDRALCLAGLGTVYGLQFDEFVPQRSLAFTAEALRRGEIEIGLMFSTSAELDDPELVALVDDRRMQPAENIVPIMRSEARDRWGPDVISAIDLVSRHLTTGELRKLNRRVANGDVVEDVARQWLAANDLLAQG